MCVVTVAVGDDYGNFYSVCTIVFSICQMSVRVSQPRHRDISESIHLYPMSFENIYRYIIRPIFYDLPADIRSEKQFRGIFLFLKRSRKKKTIKEKVLVLDSTIRHFPLLPCGKKHTLWGGSFSISFTG